MHRQIGLLLFLISGVASAVRPGDVAPDFTLNDVAGKKVSLSSLRGQPVVLTFWATWCLVCKEELPELNHEAARANVKNMFAVSATDTPKAALAYFKQGGLNNISALVGAPGATGNRTGAGVAKAYRIIGQPVAVFIDQGGKVAAVHAGEIPPSVGPVRLQRKRTSARLFQAGVLVG